MNGFTVLIRFVQLPGVTVEDECTLRPSYRKRGWEAAAHL